MRRPLTSISRCIANIELGSSVALSPRDSKGYEQLRFSRVIPLLGKGGVGLVRSTSEQICVVVDRTTPNPSFAKEGNSLRFPSCSRVSANAFLYCSTACAGARGRDSRTQWPRYSNARLTEYVAPSELPL